jgi:hypothetical protein
MGMGLLLASDDAYQGSTGGVLLFITHYLL